MCIQHTIGNLCKIAHFYAIYQNLHKVQEVFRDTYGIFGGFLWLFYDKIHIFKTDRMGKREKETERKVKERDREKDKRERQRER